MKSDKVMLTLAANIDRHVEVFFGILIDWLRFFRRRLETMQMKACSDNSPLTFTDLMEYLFEGIISASLGREGFEQG